jgi:CheY-like chemotaxis protein
MTKPLCMAPNRRGIRRTQISLLLLYFRDYRLSTDDEFQDITWYPPCTIRKYALSGGLFVSEFAADQHHKVILIADDDVLMRNRLRDALWKEYDVLIAASGSEALQVSRQSEGIIDLLIVDIQMPSMHELAVCRQIRAERPQIKTVLFADSAADPLAQTGEFVSFLRKPFEIVELRTQIKQLLLEPLVAPEDPKVILVVDEKLKRRERTRRILTDNGYAVLTARTLQHGREIADGASKIDLIIAAVTMDGEGIRLAESVDASGRDISTLLISHFSPDLLKGIAGFSAQPEFLENPFTREALLDRVSRLLERTRGR